MILRRFGSADEAARELALQVAGALRQGLELRGEAVLAVPGGRTPVPLFHALREADLDWARVIVTVTDERRVPADDPASNARLVRTELLAGHAATARFVPLHEEGDLRSLPQPFDAVVLGMGGDGHFASLFPGNAVLAQALDSGAVPACVAMQAPAAPRARLSLNLAALLRTRRLFLFVTGEAKRHLLDDAARAAGAGQWPIAALLAQRRVQVEVYWAP